MLKFVVYPDGRAATDPPPRGAHLVGVDDVGIRSNIRFEDGRLIAEKAAAGPAAMALQFQAGSAGELLLQTCLLPERDEPYLLTLELARHRLMKLIAKQEDWAMFEAPPESPARQRLDLAKQKFVQALSLQDDLAAADELARQSLEASIQASEELSLAHADALLTRRTAGGTLSRYTLGCGVTLEQSAEQIGPALSGNIDYLCIHAPWRTLEPREQERHWQPLDQWCEWALKHRLPVIAGPLVCFAPGAAPDWLYVWENDYESVRDLLYKHIELTVARYKNAVSLWSAVSGIHLNGRFPFNFEQMMDLTRMAVMLTKKTNHSARTLIEVCQPFGEYYATNQRSIPPLMYAEMAVQAGIPFDAFGLRVVMGGVSEGHATRDLLQLSALLDRFNGLGKPVHVTAAAVPSDPPPNAPGDAAVAGPGYWHKPWSAQVQAQWLEKFYQVALSKPFVESVSWLDVVDDERSELPAGGLMTDGYQPKPAFRKLSAMRKTLHEPASAS